MPPRRYIERYLAFLLGHRWPVIFAIAIATLYFAYFTLFHMTVFTELLRSLPARATRTFGSTRSTARCSARRTSC